MQIDRRKGTDRETDTSVCWFTPQIAALAEARSPELCVVSPVRGRGPGTWPSSAAFPGSGAGSWI